MVPSSEVLLAAWHLAHAVQKSRLAGVASVFLASQVLGFRVFGGTYEGSQQKGLQHSGVYVGSPVFRALPYVSEVQVIQQPIARVEALHHNFKPLTIRSTVQIQTPKPDKTKP